MALLIIFLADRLGEETIAATEFVVREEAAFAVAASQKTATGRTTEQVMDTILHEAGNVADLYPARPQTD